MYVNFNEMSCDLHGCNKVCGYKIPWFVFVSSLIGVTLIMADRFLQLLKETNVQGYEQLMVEIEKYKRALDYVDEFMDGDDEKLCQALENAEKKLHEHETSDNSVKTSDVCDQKILDQACRKRKISLESEVDAKSTKISHAQTLTCEICKKILKTKKSLTAHRRTHYVVFSCSCGKTFNHQQNFYTHRKTCVANGPTQKATFKCKHCEIPFDDFGTLASHVEQVHPLSQMRGITTTENADPPTPETDNTKKQRACKDTFKCKHCGIPFDDFGTLANHVEQVHPLSQMGMGNATAENVDPGQSKRKLSNTKKQHTFRRKRHQNTNSSLNSSVQSTDLLPFNEEKNDLLLFYAKVKSEVKEILYQRRQKTRNIKFYLNTRVRMVRDLHVGEDSSTVPHFRSATFTALEDEDVEHELNSAFKQMETNMEEFINRRSDWRMDEVIRMEIVTVPYVPLGGSSYIPLPPEYNGIRSVVNIQNQDKKCFLWSILAALHPAKTHPERVNHYVEFENNLNMTDIDYPVSISKIPKFETQNSISVNVFGMEEGEIFPLYLSKLSISRMEVDLLYLQNEQNAHYCLIKDLNKFLGLTKRAKIRHHFCRRCLHGFIRKDLLEEHIPYCKQFDFQHVKYPEEGKDDILEFTNFRKQLRLPFVIYADMETVVEKIDTCMPNPEKSSTTHESHFEPCGYAYKVVCCNEKYTKPPVVYRGKNAVKHLLENLLDEEEYIKDILADNEPLIMNDESEKEYRQAKECHICHKPFASKTVKVRDHYHIGVTGDINSPNYTNYRGAACQDCNLNFREPNYIPVVFHNLRGFDGHLLCQAIGKYKDKDIKCIAQNMDRYISTSLGDLRFIDSFQFMSTSLENLVENLSAEGLAHFKHFRDTFKNDDIAKLLLRKNIFCYSHIDSFQRFEEKQLPPKDAFYNELKQEHISDEDYEYVQKVWSTLGMETLGDLHDSYVTTDVLLLADVFEKFRDMTLDYYGLDAAHYMTAPGLAWDAALKMSDVCLDLLTDPLMYNFFESGLRGGVSMISKKHYKANNPHVENYDPSKPNTYIMYYDVNNLYGGVMRKPLPYGMFRWLTEKEILDFDINSISENASTGYTLEVDLEYPDELHDDHNCFPVAPEHKTVMEEEISPYNKELWNSLFESKKRGKTSKLVPTLEDKKNYILHYRNLQTYLDLGLKCTKIHRILEYRQKPWLQSYIDFNSEKRKNAKNDFEKDFFKLMNNAVFGKTMENLRNRVDIKLIQTEKKLKKYCAKPSFHRVQIFNNDLVGVENKKVTLLLNKPVYVGQTILDLSKIEMYNFHYNVMKKKYGRFCSTLYSDTDSMIYGIETNDVYKDMVEQKHLYDLSNYPTDHALYDATNKKVVLKMKDECAGM